MKNVILIACGTRPAHTSGIPIDGKRIIDSDQLMNATSFPSELIVVGAGVAAGTTRLMGDLLYKVSPRDPAVFAGAFAVMAVAAIAVVVVTAARVYRWRSTVLAISW